MAISTDIPQNHHFDRHAAAIIGILSEGDPLDPFTPEQVAAYLHRSESWLTVARSKGYGPRFVKFGPHMVMYLRGDLVAYLRSRVKHRKTVQRKR